MTLTEAIDAYITLKRSLGAVFSADTRILRSFARALGDIAVHDIDPKATREFCRGKGAPTRWWERKDETLVLRLARQPHTSRPVHFQRTGPAYRVLSSPTSTPASMQRRF